MILARKYNPNVANRETTMFLKIGFVKISPNVNGPSAFAKFSIPLNANRNAATYRKSNKPNKKKVI